MARWDQALDRYSLSQDMRSSLWTRVKQMLDKGLKGIEKRLAGRVEKGKFSQAEKDTIMGRIKTSTKMEDLDRL